MRRSSSSVVTTASTVLASTPTSAPGGSVFTSGGITTNVGKVASALLAKHVRTLEVLHSLQLDNAKLRQDIQVSDPGAAVNDSNLMSTRFAGAGMTGAPYARKPPFSPSCRGNKSHNNSITCRFQLFVDPSRSHTSNGFYGRLRLD